MRLVEQIVRFAMRENWLTKAIRRFVNRRPPSSETLRRYREALVAYVGAKRGWLDEFEKCAIAAAPDAHEVIRDRFRLQSLYDQRLLRRFDYLAAHRRSWIGPVSSLSELTARIDSSFSELDRIRAAANDRTLHDLESEIDWLRAIPEASIREALSSAEGRAEYRGAVDRLRRRMGDIEASLLNKALEPPSQRRSSG
jgi:hypothetical protein